MRLSNVGSPWDVDNPDLRGFCLHGKSEADVVGRLGPELRDFLQHLGFEVCGDLTLVRSVESDHFCRPSISRRPSYRARTASQSERKLSIWIHLTSVNRPPRRANSAGFLSRTGAYLRRHASLDRSTAGPL
jgi:hypothetical protein